MPVETAGMVVRIVGALALILGLLAIVAWYMRRMAPGIRGGDLSLIQVKAVRMVAPKHYISLVEVDGHTLVIGTWEQGMVLLTSTPPGGRGFESILSGQMEDVPGEGSKEEGR